MATEPDLVPTPVPSDNVVSTPPPPKEEGNRFRVSQFDLQNTSIAHKLGTSTGDLDVENAVEELLETRKNSKLLTKVIIGLVAYSVVLTAAIFGVSIAAAEVAKDTTIDPSSGFVYAKHGEDSPIMKTAEAIESFKTQSVHSFSNKALANLLSVSFEDGTVRFQVMGFGSTEEKTMLLVEGGALTFDDTGLVDFTGDLPSLVIQPFGHEGKGGRQLQDKNYDVVAVSSYSLDQRGPDGNKCVSNKQCMDGYICKKIFSQETQDYEYVGTCDRDLPDGDKQCVGNKQCMDGYICEEYICIKGKDLPDGEICDSNDQCQTRCGGGLCGGQPDGKPCNSNSDCNGWFCYDNICTEKVPNEKPCIENAHCRSMYCLILESGSSCKDSGHLQNDGEPCTSSNQCHRDRICDPQGNCNKLADGKSCERRSQCQSDFCNSHRTCGKLPDGETCVGYPMPDDCQTSCVFNTCGYTGRCRIPLNCEHSDVCTRGGYCGKRNVGQTCEEDDDCLDPLCADNLCHGRNTPDGSSCERHEECASEHCNRCSRGNCGIRNRVCGKSAAGIICQTNGDCISGKCPASMGRCID